MFRPANGEVIYLELIVEETCQIEDQYQYHTSVVSHSSCFVMQLGGEPKVKKAKKKINKKKDSSRPKRALSGRIFLITVEG